MFTGAHVILYSEDAEADRAFFRDVLEFDYVDAGHGWLIFALPPAEAAFHPSDAGDTHELYLMCDDLEAELASLAGKGVRYSRLQDAPWGHLAEIELPGGGEIRIYQPRHPTTVGMDRG